MTQEIRTVANPFEQNNSQMPVQQQHTMIEAESQKQIQEIQAALVIAKKFPRNPVECMERIKNSCMRPTLAGTALYSYSRGGTEITGPSIRLAEALAQDWENIQFGLRELSSENGVSTVQAFAWDVERNIRQEKTFQVPHVRYTRANGVVALKDPRDIYEKIANDGARRMRNCILSILPGDVVETAVAQCHETQKATIDTSPEKIKAMASAFHDEFNVPTELIEKRIQRKLETIQPAQMMSLKRIYQSMRDGMSKPSDWFDLDDPNLTEGPTTKTSDLKLDNKSDKPAETEKKTVSETEEEAHGGDKVDIVEPPRDAPPPASDEKGAIVAPDNVPVAIWVGNEEAGYYEDHFGNRFEDDKHAVDSEGIPQMTPTGRFKKIAKKSGTDASAQTSETSAESSYGQSDDNSQHSEEFNAIYQGINDCEELMDLQSMRNRMGREVGDNQALWDGEFKTLMDLVLAKKAEIEQK